jgi:NAD(P)-dependent dehydrogenase (short-subunit alcohol dehydrogenase family)
MAERNQYKFSARYAIVTGSGAGIGLAIAHRLVERGVTVSLWERDPDLLKLARSTFGDVKPLLVAVDVADGGAVAVARDETLAAAGGIDILVTSAGITGPNNTLWDYPFADRDRVINVNLRGLFLCYCAVVPHMRKKNYGRIVNIVSIAGKEGNPNASAYSASKAGVIGMTKSLGKELAQTEIRVNCITSAAVRTGILSQVTQQHIDFMLSKIPMNRFGEVEEIAAPVAWLSSEECSFSTAAVLDISGGRGTY